MTVWGRRRPFSGKWHSQYLSCPWLSGVSGVSVTPWLSELRSGVKEDAFNVGQAFLHDVTGILHDFWDGLKRNITTDISSNTRSWDILGIHLALRVLFGKFSETTSFTWHVWYRAKWGNIYNPVLIWMDAWQTLGAKTWRLMGETCEFAHMILQIFSLNGEVVLEEIEGLNDT